MKPAPLRYVRPPTLDQALADLAAGGEDAKVLAGGQSLVPMLNFRLARPTVLVDVMRCAELRSIAIQDDTVMIGAAVRQSEAEHSPELERCCPAIGRALRHVGHLQTRARGTVVGSIAHADPAAELPAVALALDASLVVRSVRGERLLPAADAIVGPYSTRLEADEIVTHLQLRAQAQSRAACLEVARRAGDFALAGIVAVAGPSEDGEIAGPSEDGEIGSALLRDVRLAAFGVGPRPCRLTRTERLLEAQAISEELLATAGAEAALEIEPVASGSGEALYRRSLVATLVGRAVTELCR